MDRSAEQELLRAAHAVLCGPACEAHVGGPCSITPQDLNGRLVRVVLRACAFWPSKSIREYLTDAGEQGKD